MPDPSSPLEVWRVEEPVRRLAVAVALVFVALAAFLTVIGVALVGAVILWILAIAIMLGMWRWFLVPYVALTSEHLEVQGVLSLRAVDYGSISAVTPGSLGLQVRTVKGGSILVWAIQKSRTAERRHRNTRADDVAAAIMDRVQLRAA